MVNKELWEAIASHYGLKLGEKFKLVGYDAEYRFSEEGLEVYLGGTWEHTPQTEADLLHGDVTISIPSWRPVRGDKYFYITVSKDGYDGDIDFTVWNFNTFDFMAYSLRNCFRSEREAEHWRDKVKGNIEKAYYNRGNDND